MPTYEYQCDACGHRFEAFQSIKADPIKRCPVCKKMKVKRLISAGGGLIFKGSGFYITDYRDKGYADKAKADVAPAAGDGKSDSKPDSKSDAKPETKSEPKTDTPAATPAGESKPAAKSESSKSESPRSDSAKPNGGKSKKK